MKIYKSESGIILEHQDKFFLEEDTSWDQLINRKDLFKYLNDSIQEKKPVVLDLSKTKLVAPIESQEIWASGVTYYSSRSARMEESEDGGDVYDRVYAADRPELFFKANKFSSKNTTSYTKN